MAAFQHRMFGVWSMHALRLHIVMSTWIGYPWAIAAVGMGLLSLDCHPQPYFLFFDPIDDDLLVEWFVSIWSRIRNPWDACLMMRIGQARRCSLVGCIQVQIPRVVHCALWRGIRPRTPAIRDQHREACGYCSHGYVFCLSKSDG